MKHHDEEMLNRAIEQLRYSAPDAGSVTASAERIAHRLGIAPGKELAMENTNKTETIKSCSDVQELLGAYRAGTLSTARALLVEAHLHDCGECLRQYSIAKSSRPERKWMPSKGGLKAPHRACWHPVRGYMHRGAARRGLHYEHRGTGFIYRIDEQHDRN